MMEGIEHSSKFITLMSPVLDSISASGEYPSPTLNLTANIVWCNPVYLLGMGNHVHSSK